jgi:hypothetical protein
MPVWEIQEKLAGRRHRLAFEVIRLGAGEASPRALAFDPPPVALETVRVSLYIPSSEANTAEAVRKALAPARKR